MFWMNFSFAPNRRRILAAGTRDRRQAQPRGLQNPTLDPRRALDYDSC